MVYCCARFALAEPLALSLATGTTILPSAQVACTAVSKAGIRSYAGQYAEALINATHDLISDFKDPKAAVIVTGELQVTGC